MMLQKSFRSRETKTVMQWSVSKEIGYDNRTGAPEGMPLEFARLVIAFPDRLYGTWWYIDEDGTPSPPQGWYIWIESVKLLGVTNLKNVAWSMANDLEIGLILLANELRAK